jgi:hypothetical protein
MVQEKIKANTEIDPISGCWNWKRAINKNGYGLVHYGKCRTAHRVAYELFIGEIPKGAQVLHKCDNPRCINPEHLFLGSHQDNMNDCLLKDRKSKGIARYNHILDEEKVRTIRNLSAMGLNAGEIGEQLGVKKITVWMVICRRNWKWVT